MTVPMIIACDISTDTDEPAATEVPAAALAPVRRNLQALLTVMPEARIALAVGLNRKTVRWIASGRAEAGIPPGYRVGVVHVERILGLAWACRRELHHGAADTVPVEPTGTVRRLRALVAAGHPAGELARRLCVAAGTVEEVLAGGVDGVAAGFARAVARLFDTAQMAPGPCSQARAYAATRKWVPALGWDEDDIDNPAALPHLGADKQRGNFPDRYADMRALGFSDLVIADKLDIQPASLFRQIKRYNLTPTEELVAEVSRLKWAKQQRNKQAS
jgi:hypothetical protein